MRIINKSASDTQKLFASLEQRSAQTQEKLSQNFQDAEQSRTQHIIDKVLTYIRESIVTQQKENNPNTKNLVEELTALEDQLIRNKRSTNTEKNKESIQQALRIIDQLELIHIQHTPNEPLFADTSIGSRDLELAYSSYTRRDIRHPEEKPHLNTYERTQILGQFLRKDILHYTHSITPQYIMEILNQAIYVTLILYILYGIAMLVIGREYIQDRTYNLINIGVLGITRYAIYKIYQKYTKNIYITILAVIIVRQLITYGIYSYIAL